MPQDIDEKGEILRCAAKAREIKKKVRNIILYDVKSTPAVNQNVLIILTILDVMTDMKLTLDKLGINNPGREAIIKEAYRMMCEEKNIKF